MPRINLLPPAYRLRRVQRRILAGVAAGGLAVVVGVVGWGVLLGGQIAREREAARREQALNDRIRAEIARLQQFADLREQVDAKRATLATALANDVAWSKFLNDLALIMPDNSWLTSLSLQAAAGQAPTGEPQFGSVSFQGFVFDFPGLAGWLTRLAQVDGLTFVYLQSGTRQTLFGRDVVSFGATASVVRGLLSQRCQPGRPCP